MFTEAKRKTQEQRVLNVITKAPATSLMLAVRLGILRSNITRYLYKWERQGKVAVVAIKKCPISKHKAKYYSAKPEDLPKQTKLPL